MNTPENEEYIEKDSSDVTKKFEDAKIQPVTDELLQLKGINFIDKHVINMYNMKTGLSKRHPRERLATIHRKIIKEKIKLQREAELKAKAEEIKY